MSLGLSLYGLSQHNDTNSRTHYVYLSYGYTRAPRNVTFTTGGGRFEIGLNVARFFSDKFFLGITFGTQCLFSNSVNQNLSNEFVTDFNNNFFLNADNLEDSAQALTLKGGINNKNKFGINANLINSFGILFSPFPDRFGGIALQVNYASNLFGFYGVNNIRPRVYDWDSNLTSLHSIRSWQYEIKLKPYYFFKKGKVVVLNEDNEQYFPTKSEFKNTALNIAKATTISFYLETLSFKNTGFAGKSLNEYVKQPFLDKYEKDYHFGFKIAFAVY